MSQVLTAKNYGLSIDDLPNSEEYLTLHFSPTRSPRQQRWRHYGLSADFLGDYFSNFFPGEEESPEVISRRDTIKASVSYIANELLENAVKYSCTKANRTISITLALYEHDIVFHSENYSDVTSTERYQGFIQNLLETDINELYLTHLEASAIEPDESQMGLLTMIQDYSAQFGWSFRSLDENPDIICTKVAARLSI